MTTNLRTDRSPVAAANFERLILPQAEERSFASRVLDEAQMFGSGIAAGVKDQLQKPPLEIASGMAESAALATGLAVMAAKNGTAGAFLSRAATTSLQFDLGLRALTTGTAAIDTWINPDNKAENSKLVAQSLGSGIVDYGLLGLPAFAAYRQSRKYLELTPEILQKVYNAPGKSASDIPTLKLGIFENVKADLQAESRQSTLSGFYRQNKGSAVTVELRIASARGNATATGSGFVASEDGTIVTNYHVARGADALNIYSPNEPTYSARLVARDRAADLALLKIDPAQISAGKLFTPAKLGDSSTLRSGDPINMIGHPRGTPHAVLSQGQLKNRVLQTYDSPGGTSQIEQWQLPIRGNKKIAALEVKLPHQNGNSGSGMLDAEGKIVGVFSWGDEVTGGGASVEHVKALLNATRGKIPDSGWLDVKSAVDDSGVVNILSVNHLTRLSLAKSVNGKFADHIFSQCQKRTIVDPGSDPLAASKMVALQLVQDRLIALSRR